jgi:ribonuclease P protein component
VSYSFPKNQRLLTTYDFEKVLKSGHILHFKTFKCYYKYLPITRDDTSYIETYAKKLGLSISRKISNALLRNRMKRLIREWFRTSFHNPYILSFQIRSFIIPLENLESQKKDLKSKKVTIDILPIYENQLLQDLKRLESILHQRAYGRQNGTK